LSESTPARPSASGSARLPVTVRARGRDVAADCRDAGFLVAGFVVAGFLTAGVVAAGAFAAGDFAAGDFAAGDFAAGAGVARDEERLAGMERNGTGTGAPDDEHATGGGCCTQA
jgi:hypothetical protein